MSKRNTKHKFIHDIANELFSFGHALIPDELQVNQIVMDSFHLGKRDSEAKDLLDQLLEDPDSNALQFLYKKRLCKILYQMSLKRFFQLKDGLDVRPEESAFNALDLEKKAVLFLKHKMNFDLEDVSSVVDQEANIVLSTLSAGRDELLANAGEVNF